MSGGAPCPGCGVQLADFDGPTHPYIGSNAACWALYGELLAHEYAELGYPECHRLTVDAYAAQHAGERSSQAIQSVGTHLTGLYLVIERGLDGPAATALKNQVLASEPPFRWLAPPGPGAALNIGDVLQLRHEMSHCDAVEAWGRSVWESWSLHHQDVCGWVEEALDRVSSVTR